MNKKLWAKSTNGPDEIDVMALLTAISAVHEGRVEIVLRRNGIGFSPSVMVTCRATFDVVDGSSLPAQVIVENGWPCSEHQTLWAHIYDGLHRLDSAIQTSYEQMNLP